MPPRPRSHRTIRSYVAAHRRGVLTAALVVFLLSMSFAGMQASISRSDDACFETPPGYLVQRVVDVRRTWWSNDCVLDPGTGDPVYTIHRPWQSVRPIEDIDGD